MQKFKIYLHVRIHYYWRKKTTSHSKRPLNYDKRSQGKHKRSNAVWKTVFFTLFCFLYLPVTDGLNVAQLCSCIHEWLKKTINPVTEYRKLLTHRLVSTDYDTKAFRISKEIFTEAFQDKRRSNFSLESQNVPTKNVPFQQHNCNEYQITTVKPSHNHLVA